MIYFIDPITLVDLNFILDVTDQTKLCEGSNKAEEGNVFWRKIL